MWAPGKSSISMLLGVMHQYFNRGHLRASWASKRNAYNAVRSAQLFLGLAGHQKLTLGISWHEWAFSRKQVCGFIPMRKPWSSGELSLPVSTMVQLVGNMFWEERRGEGGRVVILILVSKGWNVREGQALSRSSKTSRKTLFKPKIFNLSSRYRM